jgi:hypothetical protein
VKLKQAALQVMDRDVLKRVTDELGIDGVDRRDRSDMAAAVSRKHRATPEFLLEFLSEAQVKEVCELVGVSTVGRRGALIGSLVAGEQVDRRDDSVQAETTTTPERLDAKWDSGPIDPGFFARLVYEGV